MGNSLRDALTQAGVVSTRQAKVSAQQSKKERHAKRAGAATEQDEIALAAAKAQAEKCARDREMNQAREAAVAAKAARAQARQLLQERVQNDASATLTFHFVENGRVCHVYVTETQRETLTKGQLSIVALGERHYLVPNEVADRVRTLAPAACIHLLENKPPAAGDDPYAAYPVPDDLVW